MDTAITLILIAALLIACVKIAIQTYKDREWALGTVMILAIIAALLVIVKEVWS